MELFLSFAVFLFGILTWLPFINGVYGHDVAGTIVCWDHCLKTGDHLYNDTANPSVGHFFHISFLIKLWGKFNAKAFYGIMCVYCAISSFVLFWLLLHLFGTLPAVFGSMLFSLYIVCPRLEGNCGPFEQLIPLPLFTSMLCIVLSLKVYSIPLILFGGILLGYAILIKQISAVYIPGYLLMLAGSKHLLADQLTFSAGVLITNSIPPIYYWVKHNAFWNYLIVTWLFQLPAALNPKKYNRL